MYFKDTQSEALKLFFHCVLLSQFLVWQSIRKGKKQKKRESKGKGRGGGQTGRK